MRWDSGSFLRRKQGAVKPGLPMRNAIVREDVQLRCFAMLLSLGLDPRRRLPFEQVERSAQELFELQIFRIHLEMSSAVCGHGRTPSVDIDCQWNWNVW